MFCLVVAFIRNILTSLYMSGLCTASIASTICFHSKKIMMSNVRDFSVSFYVMSFFD